MVISLKKRKQVFEVFVMALAKTDYLGKQQYALPKLEVFASSQTINNDQQRSPTLTTD
jgi:hypothetical protein